MEICEVEALRRERDEADRRAGAAERLLARALEKIRKQDAWLAQAKRDAGFDDYVSFDCVWEACLKAYKEK